MNSILKHPLFTIGILLRLVLLMFVLPQPAEQWYIPFMESSLKFPGLDPWHTFISAGGTPLAFPYGYVMWLTFIPLMGVCHLAGIDLYWGYGLTLLAADYALLCVLQRLIPVAGRKLLLLYWLSPLVLFANYWLGLNDVIPILLLCLALLNTRRLRMIQAGALCGAAVSAKLSMVLAIPLFGVFLYRNKAIRHLLRPFFLGLTVALVVFGFPFLLSPDALRMLLNNPQMQKIYDLAIQGKNGAPIYMLPLAYLLMCFLAWRIRRISFDLFLALLGISFFLVLLLTPSSAGWVVWALPFLVFYQSVSGYVATILVGCFSLLYITAHFLSSVSPTVLGSVAVSRFAFNLNTMLGEHGNGLLHTFLLTFGVILVLRIWRETVRTNDFFRISRRPLVIGIAGDSGSGKDTLVESLAGLFGRHSVVVLSGDDYHFWDRHKPMWHVMTHLNPRANDLERFIHDLTTLQGGKPILNRHYDHAKGLKSKLCRVKSNDIIIASGLHALYLPILRDCYDLSIYLDMDESLRRHLKVRRDVHERGHCVETVLTALDKREADAGRFIRPQSAYADLVLSLQPIHPRTLDEAEKSNPLRLKLFVRSRHNAQEESLVRVLVGVCGLHVDMALNGDNSEVELTIEGESSPEDIELAARELFPELSEILDTKPAWEGGIKGLMQLVILSHINQTLRRRLI